MPTLKNKSIPIIEVEGTPSEIGFKLGEKAKEQIGRTIAVYKSMCIDYAQLSWDDARLKSKKYLENIKNFDEGIFLEMVGISEGSGVDLEDICVINCRSEILLGTNAVDGCTTVGITSENTVDNIPILAQNWDWKPEINDALIIQIINQTGKPKIKMITEAGIVGKIGLNTSGLGVCMNALTTGEVQPCGLPLHILIRGILNSNCLSEAVKLVADNPIPGSVNLMLGHSNGEVMDIEIHQDDWEVFNPISGKIAHTNHFLSSKFRHKYRDAGISLLPDSYVRYRVISKCLNAFGNQIKYDDIKMCLTDHTEFSGSICRHENMAQKPELRMATLFSVVMNLKKNEFYLKPGKPCETHNEQII